MENKILSRRDFLRLATITAGGAMLTACTAVAPAAPQGGAAAGQASSAAPAAAQTTVRWQDWSDYEPYMDKLNALLKSDLPDLNVEFEALSDDFQDKTLTMMVAGTAPDVMTGWGPVFRKWSEKGQLMDLQPLVDKDFTADQIKDFHQWQWDGMVGRDSGIRFAVPYYVNLIMLLYNKDAFDAAGVAYPTADMDHTDYAGVLKKMTKKDGDKVAQWGGFIQAWSYDRIQFHIQSYGGHISDPDDWTECVLDKPEAQDALEWIRARMWDDSSIAQPLQVQTTSESQMWPSGLVATAEAGMGNIASYAKNAKFKWAMTHLPKGTKRRATLGTTDGWAIYKSTPNPDGAWELTKLLVGPVFQNFMIESLGSIPNRHSLLSSWKDKAIQSFPVLQDANLDVVLEALQEGYPVLTEEFKDEAQSETLLTAALQKVYQVGDTPVSYFEQVAQQVTAANREA